MSESTKKPSTAASGSARQIIEDDATQYAKLVKLIHVHAKEGQMIYAGIVNMSVKQKLMKNVKGLKVEQLTSDEPGKAVLTELSWHTESK